MSDSTWYYEENESKYERKSKEECYFFIGLEERHTNKLIFEQRLHGRDGMSHEHIRKNESLAGRQPVQRF